jgi:hypothetical protein
VTTTKENSDYVLQQLESGYHDFDLHQDFTYPVVKNVYLFTNFVTKGGPVRQWRKVILSGNNATTYMSGKLTRYSHVPGSGTQEVWFNPSYAPHVNYQTDFGWWSGDLIRLGPPTLVDPSSPTSATNRALTNYYAQLANCQSRFKGGTFVGELREALHLVRSPASALRRGIGDYLSHVKKHGRKVAKRKRKAWVGETWLEYAFGWRPLISDIDSAMFELAKLNQRPPHEMVTGTGRSTYTIQSEEAGASKGLYEARFCFRDTHAVIVRFYGVYHHDRSLLPEHNYGFSPHEFVPTLWELIPYSFLVDYFTNIGNIISCASYRSLRNGWTAKTLVSDRTRTIVILSENSGTSYNGLTRVILRGNPGGSTWQIKEFERVPDLDPGVPTLEFTIPGFSSTKWLNIAALGLTHSSARRHLAL